MARSHGRERTDHPDAEQLVIEMPPQLWAEGPTDVGLTNCDPITFQVQSCPPQISETIIGLLDTGVLEDSYSSWNTPILPVEKKGTGNYRMAHDLRAINSILITPTVPVPNPYVVLTNLEPTHSWFTCIDLANAFFCLPLAESCRDIFSFTYRGRQLRYTRLSQGFALSPGIFNQVLRTVLESCSLPDDVILIQYVDDLLLAAPTTAVCCLQPIAPRSSITLSQRK